MSEVEQEEKLTQDPIAGIGTMVWKMGCYRCCL